jgi:hypothetical protein
MIEPGEEETVFSGLALMATFGEASFHLTWAN